MFYKKVSIKTQTRTARAKSKKCKSLFIIRSIDSRDVLFPATRDEFNDFLSVDINKIALQRFIGEQFLQQAPADTVVIVAGLFDDATEVIISSARDIIVLILHHNDKFRHKKFL